MLKWCGTAATVLLLLVWLGSGFVSVIVRPACLQRITINRGRVRYFDYTNTGAVIHDRGIPKHFQATNSIGMDWGFQFDVSTGTLAGVRLYLVPIWPFILVTGIPSVIAWNLDRIARRAPVGACPACGYSRAGLTPAAPCPECGKPAEAAT
jgi:hypothetical protein